ncbi:dienelactone hydrolase family protein [Paenibacillus filicis]|uniref:Dienelactone hydrolase family protein n=1 Tax=Paenibacillus gyeongsangnamensis TaxID=3388067 RepID=A0ABT4Q2F1_9BACL|nr:alpha/beta fold hydrolase [Paenibacillus filicis]MCZ8510880.1 dienelactone hydrolase family protein [Paenibacillus filicis]
MGYKFSKFNEAVLLPEIILEHEASVFLEIERWTVIRREILTKLCLTLGNFPPSVPASFEVLGEDLIEGRIVQKKICYASNDGDKVPAYLLYAQDAVQGSATIPSVLALHQTVTQGKDEVVGISGNSDLMYGLELARRGYAVLAPDVLSAGERIFGGKKPYQTAPFEDRYPEWSMIGKMIYDHQQGLDTLSLFDFVDMNRIGVIGHSLGGTNAFFLAAFDNRIKAVVSSCGFGSFAGDPTPERWGLRREWFTYIPKLNEFLSKGEAPFEFNEVAAAIAPRAYFNWSTQNDKFFPHWEAIGKSMLTIKRVYDGLEVPQKFSSLIGEGEHSFPAPIRKMAYQWLDRQLNDNHD